jgi:NAD(P)-dependent dehydrogenase (short-subunit alcohol dehydrogenase family)
MMFRRRQREPRLVGRRVLITGASSGVGLAATRLFAREGARLAVVSRRSEAFRALLRAEAIEAVCITADLGDRAAAQAAVETAAEVLGGLDVVVSNAAAAVFGHVGEVHPDDFDRTISVTFTGAVDVIRAALPHLRASGGVVVATGSLMSRVPLPTWSSYVAAKHALRGFLNSLRVEEREQRSGVRVAMVHPGPIDTPLFSHASSGTGRKPRVAPDAYRPEVIAHALVEVAIRPRPEVVLGGETRLLDLLFAGPRPVAEAVLLVIDRWYRSGDEPTDGSGSLWRAPVEPQLSGGIPSRAVCSRRSNAGAHAPRFGGVLAPDAPRGARGQARSRAVTAIVHPVPECLAPAHSLREAEHTPPPVRAGQRCSDTPPGLSRPVES